MSLSAKQIATRRTGITSTDLRALCGKDSYGRGPADVWLDKMNMAPANDSPELFKRIGTHFEPIVLRLLAGELGLRVMPRKRDEMTVRHPKHPTHVCTPDAWLSLEGTNTHKAIALAEAKVVGFHDRFDWGETAAEEIPEGTRIQAAWESHCARIPLVHVGALLGTELRKYAIASDPDLEAALVEIADRFWRDHVLTKKPPKIDGSKASERAVRALYPRSKKLTKKADDKAERFAARFFAAEKKEREASVELEMARQALMVLCGSAERMRGDGWALSYATRKAYDVGPSKGYHVEAKRLFKMQA